MSENLDLVRSILADWERGDYKSTDRLHPDLEFVIADGPEPGRWTGLAGAEEGFRDFLSAWEGWRAEAEEYRELDDERVIVFVHRTGRGKTSGLEIGQMRTRGATLFHVLDGRVKGLVVYFDRDGALADLGLKE
jgi:ketosteroid isomerase-like protein